jgi:hypothetical protein
MKAIMSCYLESSFNNFQILSNTKLTLKALKDSSIINATYLKKSNAILSYAKYL